MGDGSRMPTPRDDASGADLAGEGHPEPRQRVERVQGARRARLTAVPDSIAEPAMRRDSDALTPETAERGPNDDRMRREKPPHY